jgi:hypothetical protein
VTVTSEERDASASDRAVHLVAGGLIGFLLAGALLLAVVVSRDRAFQVDEVEHLHVAFNVARGEELYRDFWEGHNPLLYLLLRPLADLEDPVATYRAGRWLTLVCLLTTIGATAWCARRLAGNQAALLAGGLLLFHSTMVERGIEVRPDGWLALGTVLALASELSGLPRLHRHCLQAISLGLAFLFTQKAVVLCVAFGLLWLWSAWRERRPSLVLLPVLLWSIPLAMMLGVLWFRGSLAAYLEYNVWAHVRHVTRTAGHGGSFGSWRAIRPEAWRNLFFALLALPALFVALRRPGPVRFAGLLAVAGLVYLSVNPFPFPYSHVAVLPFFAAVIAVALVAWGEQLLGHGRARGTLFVAGSLVLAAATSVPRLAGKAALGNDYQLQVLREIQRVTSRGDAVFDMAGLHARPDAYPVFVMTGVMYERYRNGVFPRMLPLWRDRGMVAMIENYRIHWLQPPEIDFLGNNMVYWGSNIYVSGAGIRDLAPGAEQRFEVLRAHRYRYEGPGQLLVNGAPMTAGPLSPGEHVLSTTTGITAGRLILDVPPPASDRPARPLFQSFD